MRLAGPWSPIRRLVRGTSALSYATSHDFQKDMPSDPTPPWSRSFLSSLAITYPFCLRRCSIISGFWDLRFANGAGTYYSASSQRISTVTALLHRAVMACILRLVRLPAAASSPLLRLSRSMHLDLVTTPTLPTRTAYCSHHAERTLVCRSTRRLLQSLAVCHN